MAGSDTGKQRRKRRESDFEQESVHPRRTKPMSTGNEPSRSQIDGDEGQNDGGIERETPISDIRNDRDVERERP
jgi:hypothetical protein